MSMPTTLFRTVARAYGTSVLRSVAPRMLTTAVPVPTMGESITEGTIASWKKKIGEPVATDEAVAVIDTDKISVDVVSPVKGYLESLQCAEGDTVFVGDLLFKVSSDPPAAASSGVSTGTKRFMATTAPTGIARAEKTIPMTRMRQRIAERLRGAVDTAVLLTTFQELDMTNIMALRKEQGPDFLKNTGVKLGMMGFFMKACAKALKDFPDINSRVAESGKEVVRPNFVDLSVAVASPNGLVVPVIRDAEGKALVELEKELVQLASKARSGGLSMADIKGGTFTISNGGVYGSMLSTPIVNPPQSAILGMHGIQPRAMVVDGKICVRPVMYLALTYDHRIVDGREAVHFLKRVTQYLEDPVSLLI